MEKRNGSNKSNPPVGSVRNTGKPSLFTSSESGLATSRKEGGTSRIRGRSSSLGTGSIRSSSSSSSCVSSSSSRSDDQSSSTSNRSSSRSFYFPTEGRPAPPSGPGAAAALEALYGPHLSVLCLNAYLIPPSISWNPYLWAPFWSCKRPKERAEQIGRLAAQYDIVCLQEVWGTNLGGLNSMVLPTHSILPETQSGSRLGWVGEIIDPVRLYTRETGGLWFAWRMAKARFLGMQRHLFDSETRVPFSNQNITAVELDVSNTFPGKRLLVVGTHFSVLGKRPRNHNIEELKAFCKQLVWKQYLHWLARQLSGTAGIRADANAAPSFVADTAFLLLGDFNLDPDKCPRDYKKLVTLDGCAEMRDLFVKKNNPNYSVQYTTVSQEGRKETIRSDGSIKYSGNSLFPWPFKGRVDYIFAVDSVYLKPDEVLSLVEELPPEDVVAPEFEELDIPILKDGGLVVSFDKITCLGMDIIAQRYGQELSDHWPLSARICLGRPAVRPEDLPLPRKEQLQRGASLCIDSSYAGASKSKQGVASLEAERELAANQLAGWRQGMAPDKLEKSQEVIQRQMKREDRKRAAAEAAAAAAELAELELQQAQDDQYAEYHDVDYYDQNVYDEPDPYGQPVEEEQPAEEVIQEPEVPPTPEEPKAPKSLPLAALRAQQVMQAKRNPLRM